MIGPMHAVPELKKRVDWGYYTTPQEHALGRKIPQMRWKGLLRLESGNVNVNGSLAAAYASKGTPSGGVSSPASGPGTVTRGC